MTKSTTGTADQQTQVAWQVRDNRAEEAELRARGINIENSSAWAKHGSPGGRGGAGLAKLPARRSTSPSGSESVKGRY
ncbi:MAG TPA: hypothetical protein VHJ18_10830 [Streptosporangiaceae bacterium]|nr:hypothetical protein [Streptosporangiaceae bacterium]